MSKENLPTSTNQPKIVTPPPIPPIPPPEPTTRKKPPPIPKIPRPENAYKNWGDKEKDD